MLILKKKCLEEKSIKLPTYKEKKNRKHENKLIEKE